MYDEIIIKITPNTLVECSDLEYEEAAQLLIRFGERLEDTIRDRSYAILDAFIDKYRGEL